MSIQQGWLSKQASVPTPTLAECKQTLTQCHSAWAPDYPEPFFWTGMVADTLLPLREKYD